MSICVVVSCTLFIWLFANSFGAFVQAIRDVFKYRNTTVKRIRKKGRTTNAPPKAQSLQLKTGRPPTRDGPMMYNTCYTQDCTKVLKHNGSERYVANQQKRINEETCTKLLDVEKDDALTEKLKKKKKNQLLAQASKKNIATVDGYFYIGIFQ